jgi:membrane-bound serine protease (ClpP class)
MFNPKRFRASLIVGLILAALLLTLALSFLACSLAAPIQPVASGNEVVIANFNVPVDPGSAAFMSRVVSTAQGDHAAAIVIEMNTPGGSVSDMLDIISSITSANQSGIPTYTFIVPNGAGASAGSYIAMATNTILMGPGSAIGPSTPIVVGGTELEQNHTQAYFLSYMQSLASNWGRNTTAVYYMVQSDQAYTADEAIAYHVADGSATSLSDALNQLGLSGNPQITLSENFYEQLLSALSDATLDGILILIGVIAIVIDVFHPTIILTILGVIAIIAGLVGAEIIGASWLGITLLIISAALIVLELKLGHGFALIGGVILGAIGIYFLSYNLAYSPSPITGLTELALILLVVGGILVALYIRWIIRPLRRRKKMTGVESMIGKIGIATTDLKPKGEVRVVGEIWRAESVSGDIAKGEKVRVKELRGLVIMVENAPPQDESI